MPSSVTPKVAGNQWTTSFLPLAGARNERMIDGMNLIAALALSLLILAMISLARELHADRPRRVPRSRYQDPAFLAPAHRLD